MGERRRRAGEMSRRLGRRWGVTALLWTGCAAGAIQGASELSAGSSGGGPVTQTANQHFSPLGNDPVTPPTTSPRLAVVGRYLSLDPQDPLKYQFGRSGVSFGARFVGTELTVTLKNLGTNKTAPLGVTVDGEKKAPITVASGPAAQFVLARDLVPGAHEVWWTIARSPSFRARRRRAEGPRGPGSSPTAGPDGRRVSAPAPMSLPFGGLGCWPGDSASQRRVRAPLSRPRCTRGWASHAPLSASNYLDTQQLLLRSPPFE